MFIVNLVHKGNPQVVRAAQRQWRKQPYLPTNPEDHVSHVGPMGALETRPGESRPAPTPEDGTVASASRSCPSLLVTRATEAGTLLSEDTSPCSSCKRSQPQNRREREVRAGLPEGKLPGQQFPERGSWDVQQSRSSAPTPPAQKRTHQSTVFED